MEAEMDTRREPIEQTIQHGLRSTLLGIGINILLAFGKCLAGVVGHSFTLIADGIESSSDVVSSTIVYLGLRVAVRPPDKEHPYGHGKAEPIAAIVVCLALVSRRYWYRSASQ
jgi:cation diffusion facilitator family transporter